MKSEYNLLCPHVSQKRITQYILLTYAPSWRVDIINYVPTADAWLIADIHK